MHEGIYHDIDRATYDAIDAVNASRLLACRKSLAHCKEQMLNPPERGPALAFGTALHTAFLEADDFPVLYVVMPAFEDAIAAEFKEDGSPKYKVPKATKAYKEQVEAWKFANGDKNVVTLDEYNQIRAMGRSLRSHPAANEMFNRGGSNECTVIWTDEETELLCKGRFDSLIEDEWPTIPDLKSTMDASPYGFAGSVAKFGYHIRGAFYVDGVSAFTSPPNLVFAAVEKEPPYAVGVYQLGSKSIETGRRIYRKLLNAFAVALDTNEWPAYSMDVEPLDIPRWAMREAGFTQETIHA